MQKKLLSKILPVP